MADSKESTTLGDRELSPDEMRFIKQGLQRNAPQLFLVQHLWTCRLVDYPPDFPDLDMLAEKVGKFIIDTR